MTVPGCFCLNRIDDWEFGLRLTWIELPSLKHLGWDDGRLMILFLDLTGRQGAFFLFVSVERDANSLSVDLPQSPGCMRSFRSFSIS